MGAEEGIGKPTEKQQQDQSNQPEILTLPGLDVAHHFVHIEISLEHTNHLVGVTRANRYVLLVHVIDFDDVVELVEMIGMHLPREWHTRQGRLHALVVARVLTDFVCVRGIQNLGRIAAVNLDLDNRHPAQFRVQGCGNLGQHLV